MPGSHHWAPINVPYVNIGDWEPAPLSPEDEARIPKDLSAPYPGELLVEAPQGSAIICNSSMWHAGTLKKSDTPRRMLHLTYTRRDLPQQLLQLDYLTPELYDRMSPVSAISWKSSRRSRATASFGSRRRITRAGGTETR